MKLVLATRNEDKLREILFLLAGAGIELVPQRAVLPDLRVVEDGLTLEENARKKAETVCGLTGLPVLGEDTALEVAALGGEPGVFSARYAGASTSYESNRKLLLEKMRAVPPEGREARFRAVCALAMPGTATVFFEGILEGTITTEPRGTSGFGYDPVFVPAGQTRTLAELGPELKNQLSHRARALAKLRDFLQNP